MGQVRRRLILPKLHLCKSISIAMSFLGGAECSTAGNPLTQFTKHVQSDNSLQRDRLVGRGSGGLEEGMRSRMAPNGSDQMMNDFMHQSGQLPQPFAMEQLRQDLPNLQNMTRRSPSPGWAAEFDPGEQARMEAAFASSKMGTAPQRPSAFSPQEFARFQQPSPRTASPITQTTDKGKGRMVELDDANWEAQFKELETRHDNLSEQANQAMEKELEEIDRQMTEDAADFDNAFSSEDYAAWDQFDSTMGLGTHNPFEREPMLGDYMFEAQNPYLEVDESEKTAFEYGKEILEAHGNLSLAALAFEAAVQKDQSHVEAWVLLGAAQAQNEKEAPAIRALETAVRLDPNNLDALMSLAVSYTNEGYDSTAYRTLERWLSVKYPHIHPPQDLSDGANIGFTDRALLHAKVVKLFIKAAQLSPSGEKMDPDGQVGL